MAIADQTHVLTIAGVYELPIGPGKKFLNGGGLAMKNLLGGWKVSWVQWYESGPPLNLVSCVSDQFDCDPLIGNILCKPAEHSLDQFSLIGTTTKSLATGNSIPVFNTIRFRFSGRLDHREWARVYQRHPMPEVPGRRRGLHEEVFLWRAFQCRLYGSVV